MQARWQDRLRKSTFLSLVIITAIIVFTMGIADAAEDYVVAVDKATLVKFIGVAILAFQAEIWRNQRSLFRSNERLGNEFKELKGFCKGRTGEGTGGEDKC